MKKLRITVEGRPYDVTVEVLSDDGAVHSNAAPAMAPESPAAAAPPPAAPRAAKAPSFPPPQAAAGANHIVSQVSGVVVSVDVTLGQQVAEGQKLMTIEAMKMHTYVMASSGGKVVEILVEKGKSVLTGDPLVRLG